MAKPVPATYDVQIRLRTPDKLYYLKINLEECPREHLLQMPMLSPALTLLESSIGNMGIKDTKEP